MAEAVILEVTEFVVVGMVRMVEVDVVVAVMVPVAAAVVRVLKVLKMVDNVVEVDIGVVAFVVVSFVVSEGVRGVFVAVSVVIFVVVVKIHPSDHSGYAELHLHDPFLHSKYLSTRQFKSILQLPSIFCCGRQVKV
jgi:hypothetical protein